MTTAQSPSEASLRVPDREDLKRRLAGRLRIDPAALSEQATLEQLGLDSLLLAETVADVETRCGVEFDMAVFADSIVPTLALGAFLDLLGDGASPGFSRADA